MAKDMDDNPFRGLTYAQSIRYIVDAYGDKKALTFQGRSYTFRDLKREADLASARIAALGVLPGETIGIWAPNRPEFAFLWFGAAQIGVIPVIINTRLKRPEFEYQIRQSKSVAVFVPGTGSFRDFAGELADSQSAVISGELPSAPFPDLRAVVALDPVPERFSNIISWQSLGENLPMPAYNTDPNSPGLIAYSSGTTSLPKGAMLSHCIWRKAYDGGGYLKLTPADSLYLTVPLFGVLGCLNGLLMFWSRGCEIHLRERFDEQDFITSVSQEKCTFAHLLPTMIERIAKHPAYDKGKFRSLRGGVILSSQSSHFLRAIDVLGADGFTSGYGLTESTGLVSRCYLDDPLEDRLGHQGWPLPDCPIRIVDPDTKADLPHGQEGEIAIGGYSVMLGYFDKPVETAACVSEDGWLYSGDLGVVLDTGALKFLRRGKDGYKHKGFNVSTTEVEAAIQTFPGVHAAAVVGVPDPEFGETGVAFVIPDGDVDLSEKQLLEYLFAQISTFKVPKAAFVVNEFPLTGGTDKIQKFKLRELAMSKLGISG